MHVKFEKLTGTQISLSITAGEQDLLPYKQTVLKKLAPQLKMPGFRKGTAPLNLVEKNIDPQLLQTEFLDEALTDLYARTSQRENIRPVTRPEVSIKKFVPFTTLEFEIVTHVIADVKLPNYKSTKLKKDESKVVAEDVDNVIKSLQVRLAEKNEVQRAAKKDDQAWIDFKGANEKGEPVTGADGTDYPLMLGSNTFIPGFEDNVTGMKPGEEKTFTLTFPKDYSVKALANKRVTFTTTLKKVEEVVRPPVDDEFAAKVGPFKTLKDLKEDIRKQLQHERQHEINREYHNELIGKIVDKTTLAVPEPLIEQQIIYSLDEMRRNLTYRGQTYQEFLESEGLSEEEHKETILRPQAERQVKTSLVLSEIAEAEGLKVTPEELEIRLQLLKGQYTDQAMQGELDKPDNRRDIASRMLTEKVLARLEEYATK